MKPRKLRQIERLLQDDASRKALDQLLQQARLDPLDGDLHRLLGEIVVAHPFRHQPPDITSWDSYRFLKPYTAGKPKHERVAVLYALPEVGADRPLAPFEPRHRAYRRTREGTGFSVPQRLEGMIPLHPPSVGFYTWYDPVVSMDDGVLTLTQFSTFDCGRKGLGNEDMRLRIYRVRGDLFHARYVRFYLWS